MKLEDIKNKTKDAVDYLVQSLESGHSEVLTQYLGAMARFHTLLLRQCDVDCQTESSDMLLYLAGVNEHAVFRIVGSKRWSVAHFLKTIQYLLEYGVRFLTT